MRAQNTVLNLETFAQAQQSAQVAQQQHCRQNQIHLRKEKVQAQRVVRKPQQGLELHIVHGRKQLGRKKDKQPHGFSHLQAQIHQQGHRKQ